MSLTSAQKATLKAYILADPVLSTKVSGPGTDYAFISTALSSPASPVVLAWSVSVSADVVDEAPDYSTFDSIVPGKRDSWGFFLRQSRNFGRNKIRKWVTDVWGNATANSNAEAILLAGTESAKVCEVALGGNSKTTGTVTALDRSYVGGVTLEEVADLFR